LATEQAKMNLVHETMIFVYDNNHVLKYAANTHM